MAGKIVPSPDTTASQNEPVPKTLPIATTDMFEDTVNYYSKRERKNNFLIDPGSKFQLVWSVCNIVFILFCLIWLPFQLAFQYESNLTGDVGQVVMWIILRIMDCFFLLDILVNFNTAYMVDDVLVQDRTKIIRRYLSGWFCIDFASSASSILMEVAKMPALNLLRNLRMLRLLRLLKLVRILKLDDIFELISQQEGEFKSACITLKIVSSTLIWAHLLACIWHAIGSSSEGDNWLTAYHGDESWKELPVQSNYLIALYWAFVTVTTVGYGDINPANNYERGFAIIAVFAGTAVFAYVVGEIQTIFTKVSPSEEEFEKKKESVEEFMSFHRVSHELRQKVRLHNANISKRHVVFDEKSILADMPYSIRREIRTAVRETSIMKVSFLKVAPIMRELAKRMHIETFLKDQVIIPMGDSCTKFYIIDTGEVKVQTGSKAQNVRCGDGDWFGETNLLQKTYSHPVKCKQDAEILSITKAEFDNVLTVEDCEPFKEALLSFLWKRNEEMNSPLMVNNADLEDRIFTFEHKRTTYPSTQTLRAHDPATNNIEESDTARISKMEKQLELLVTMHETQSQLIKDQAQQLDAIHKLLAKEAGSQNVLE